MDALRSRAATSRMAMGSAMRARLLDDASPWSPDRGTRRPPRWPWPPSAARRSTSWAKPSRTEAATWPERLASGSTSSSTSLVPPVRAAAEKPAGTMMAASTPPSSTAARAASGVARRSSVRTPASSMPAEQARPARPAGDLAPVLVHDRPVGVEVLLQAAQDGREQGRQREGRDDARRGAPSGRAASGAGPSRR